MGESGFFQKAECSGLKSSLTSYLYSKYINASYEAEIFRSGARGDRDRMKLSHEPSSSPNSPLHPQLCASSLLWETYPPSRFDSYPKRESSNGGENIWAHFNIRLQL